MVADGEPLVMAWWVWGWKENQRVLDSGCWWGGEADVERRAVSFERGGSLPRACATWPDVLVAVCLSSMVDCFSMKSKWTRHFTECEPGDELVMDQVLARKGQCRRRKTKPQRLRVQAQHPRWWEQ